MFTNSKEQIYFEKIFFEIDKSHSNLEFVHFWQKLTWLWNFESNLFSIISNYHQILLPNYKMSFFVSIIVEVSVKKMVLWKLSA